MKKLSCCCLLLVSALVVVPGVEARTCTGAGDLIGGYGWIGSRSSLFVPPPASPPIVPVAGSVTPIGVLAGGAANSDAFASVGRLLLDGNGGVFAGANSTSALLQAGKYTVNTDCTIAVTITDAFATPVEAGLPPVQATATFEGIIVQNGNEIDLVQTGAASGTILTLKKTRQINGCTPDAVGGNFGLSAQGVSTVSTVTPGTADTVTTTKPFTLNGRFLADGVGSFVKDSQGLLSPLTARQLTGTYTVNQDCSGSGTLVSSDGKTTRKIDFVIVGAGSGSAAPQSIVFVFTDKGTIGTGLAQQ
jgi:hypothetical protein